MCAEECHCLITALYRLLSQQLPIVHQKVFEEKCLEALVPLPTKPPPQLNNNSSTTTNNGVPNLNENGPFNGKNFVYKVLPSAILKNHNFAIL